MMVDKAVSTNDNNFNEFSRAYKYDAVISTLIENKILSIKKECKEPSTSKRKRRKSSRKISFSRKFFVSCRSKRSSLGSVSSNIDNVSPAKELSILSPVNDGHDYDDADTNKSEKLNLYDFENGTASALNDNLNETTRTYSKIPSDPVFTSIVGDIIVEHIDHLDIVASGHGSNQRSLSTSHDDTEFNISSQNEQSTSKQLLLKDVSTSSSAAIRQDLLYEKHRQHQSSLSSSTSSSVSPSGRYDGKIHIKVIDKKHLKYGDGDDGSGTGLGDISSNESLNNTDAIIEPFKIDIVSDNSISYNNNNNNIYNDNSNKINNNVIGNENNLRTTKKCMIPDGLVASIKHSFHSLALYSNYNNKSAPDIENNFLYEAKSISAPTSPTILFSQNIIKSQTMMISSENVKSQVSYKRNSIRCPNYTKNNDIFNKNQANLKSIQPNTINNIFKKKLKSSLCELLSRQNTSDDSANTTISTLVNENELLKPSDTQTISNNNIDNDDDISQSNLNDIRINNSRNFNLNNINKMDINSTVLIGSNDDINISNVEKRLDSVVTDITTATTNNILSEKLDDSSLFIKQNESSNQSNLNSESVIINKIKSDILPAIPTTTVVSLIDTNIICIDKIELDNDRKYDIGKSATVSATAVKIGNSDKLFNNILENQNISNICSIMPSSMTASNLMSINSSYTSKTTKTQSTTTAVTKPLDYRNALLASRMMNGIYHHSGSDDEYRRNKRKYKRYHRCSDPVLVYPTTSGLQHCILSMPPNQIHQLNYNEDFVYDLTYQADQNINDEKEFIVVPEQPKKSRHHKHKKKHRHRQKPKILVHDLDTQVVKVIDPDDLPQRAKWTIIATACLLLMMCLMLVGITLRMAPIIDEIVRQENERLMQESINRVKLAQNYTESF